MSSKQWELTWGYETEAFYYCSSLENTFILITEGAAGWERRLWLDLSFCPLSDVFMTQFSALQTARSVRTRRLAAAEENIEVARAARLAQIFKEICDSIIAYKGEGNNTP